MTRLGPGRDGSSHPGPSRPDPSHPGPSRPDPSRACPSRATASHSQRPGPDHERNQVGGITLLRLVPDQLVRDEGHQLGLWGDAFISDRVARAAVRVQAMLGHNAVTRPTLAGGRGPAEQVTLVPFGDAKDPLFPADRPWPAQIPAPAPATVYPVPLPAVITDDHEEPVTVTGRALVSAPPARLSGRRRTVARRHLVGRALAGYRTLVGPSQRPQVRQVPAGHRRRKRLAGGRAGGPLADRGQLRLIPLSPRSVSRLRSKQMRFNEYQFDLWPCFVSAAR